MDSQGNLYHRSALHDRYGGQCQGGISTPAQYPFLMLFTGESSEQHDYTDGLKEGALTQTRGVVKYRPTFDAT